MQGFCREHVLSPSLFVSDQRRASPPRRQEPLCTRRARAASRLARVALCRGCARAHARAHARVRAQGMTRALPRSLTLQGFCAGRISEDSLRAPQGEARPGGADYATAPTRPEPHPSIRPQTPPAPALARAPLFLNARAPPFLPLARRSHLWPCTPAHHSCRMPRSRSRSPVRDRSRDRGAAAAKSPVVRDRSRDRSPVRDRSRSPRRERSPRGSPRRDRSPRGSPRRDRDRARVSTREWPWDSHTGAGWMRAPASVARARLRASKRPGLCVCLMPDACGGVCACWSRRINRRPPGTARP